MVIFGAHAFVNCANNLYTPKTLSLKSAATQHLAIFTNIRKININETFAKPIQTTVNRKVPYQKYLAFTKTMNCSKCHMTKAARKGLAETSSKMVQNRPKLTFSQGLGQEPPNLDRANRQVVRFKAKMVQNEVISRSTGGPKVVKMTKI